MKPFSRKITHWQQNLPHHLESTLFDRNLLRRGDAYDKPLFWVLLCLLCFGLVMVYSASGVQAGLYHFDNRASFLIKQTQFALIVLSVDARAVVALAKVGQVSVLYCIDFIIRRAVRG